MRHLGWIGLSLSFFAHSLMAAPSVGKCERVVAVVPAISSPYLDVDAKGTVTGPYFELLNQLTRALPVTLEVQVVKTAAEAEQEVVSGRADLLLGVPLTLARVQQLDFIHPALPSDPLQVWVRAGQDWQYVGWNDLRGKRGWLAPGVTAEADFMRFAKSNLQLVASKDAVSAFAKLHKGDLDYAIYPQQAGLGLLTDESSALQAHDLQVSTEPQYLALSHNSACNDGWLRGQLSKNMTEIMQNGVAAGLLKRAAVSPGGVPAPDPATEH